MDLSQINSQNSRARLSYTAQYDLLYSQLWLYWQISFAMFYLSRILFFS